MSPCSLGSLRRHIPEQTRMSLGTNLASFFYRALAQAMREKQARRSSVGCYYEFGVGSGTYLSQYVKALKAFCKNREEDIYSYQIFGFDSFEGLPEKKCAKDNHPRWHKGLFSCSLSEIQRKATKLGIDLRRNTIHFVKGFFEETLTPTLRKELGKWSPSLVTIDVDYYSSTRTVLEWLRPILKDRTIFYFDDIWAFDGNPDCGQLAAIKEFNEVGEGHLSPYPVLGKMNYVFIYSEKKPSRVSTLALLNLASIFLFASMKLLRSIPALRSLSSNALLF
jgi:hypothetical protein